MKKLLMVIFIMCFSIFAVWAQTYVDINYNITTPQTYSDTNVIYRLGSSGTDLYIDANLTFGADVIIEIVSHIVVRNGSQLEFIEGCTVKWGTRTYSGDNWDPYVILITDGRIFAIGHPSNRVLMTGDYNDNGILDDNEGMQIQFINNNYSEESLFYYSDIEFGRTSDYDSIESNTSNGGLITIKNSTGVSFDDCSFSYGLCKDTSSQDDRGGAVLIAGSFSYFDRCLFYNNYSPERGGALYYANVGGSDALINCLFIHNETEAIGGAIYLAPDAAPIIEQCFFGNNKSSGNGPSIYSSTNWRDAEQCTFLGNDGGNQYSCYNINVIDCEGHNRPVGEAYNSYLKLHNPSTLSAGFQQNFVFNVKDWLPEKASPAVDQIASPSNNLDYFQTHRSNYAMNCIGPFEWTEGKTSNYPWVGDMDDSTFDSDRYFYGTINIRNGKTLTVSNGANINMLSPETKIIVSDTGCIDTRSSIDFNNPVRLLPSNGSSWSGIEFNDHSGSATSYLYNVSIENVIGTAGLDLDHWDNLVVERSQIKDCNINYGAIYAWYSDASIINSKIISNTSSSGSGGIYSNMSDMKVIGCLLKSNSVTSSNGGASINISGNQNTSFELINSTIMYGSNGANDYNGISIWRDKSKIYNNLFYNTGVDIRIWEQPDDESQVEIKNNFYESVAGDWNGLTIENNIVAHNPFFDLSTYEPHSNSACINAGNENAPNLALLNGDDLHGDDRIQYNRIDIGSVEFEGNIDLSSFVCAEDYDQLIFTWNSYNTSDRLIPEGFGLFKDDETSPSHFIQFEDFVSSNSSTNSYELIISELPVDAHEYRLKFSTGIPSYPYYPTGRVLNHQSNYSHIENFTASDNDIENYPGYIELEWDFANVNDGYYTGFKIDLDGSEIATVDYDSTLTHFVFHDTLSNIYPEQQYSYSVKGFIDINGSYGETASLTDSGEYTVPGVMNFSASDGRSEYPGVIRISWDWHSTASKISKFFIYKNDDPGYFTIVEYYSGTLNYFIEDSSTNPGEVNLYKIKPVYYFDPETEFEGPFSEDSGYVKPNGIISGSILTSNNNPVQGVKVTIDPSSSYCLEFDSNNSSQITIADPEVNMNYNFTIELWLKTAQTDLTILDKGDLNIKVNASGKMEYTDGTNTLMADSVSVNDNVWHHFAIVNDYSNSQTLMYVDEFIVAIDSTFLYNGSSDSGFSTSTSFTGYLDDLRIWSTARDSSEVVEGKNVVTAIDEIGLMGYWTLNEGNGNSIFDATDYNHSGTATNCDWSLDGPDMYNGAFSDEWGEYIIRQINYGSATTFTVTPYKAGHIFQPEQRNITLSTSNIAQNGVDFIDNSMIPISGQVFYRDTDCPVVGAIIYLNGEAAVPMVLTDEDGYYVLEVEHGTDCIISVDSSEHLMDREWDLGEVTFPQTNIDFEDTFKTQFRCEVVGGDDHYPIGDFDVTLLSIDGCFLETLSGNWDSGGIMITNLPPLEYNVTVDPIPGAETDPFGLTIDEQFQNMKTDTISLVDTDTTLDTLSFVWKAPLQIAVSWADTLQLYSFTDYPENEFYVLSQNVWVDVVIEAFEDYSFDANPDQITYLDNCDIVIVDEIGTQGTTETSFSDSTTFTYTFAPYLPNMLSGYNRQYQNKLEISVQDTDLNRFASQIDWVLTEGTKPQESTYSSTAPEMPFLILHDPPGDGSYATFDQSSYTSWSYEVAACTDEQHSEFLTLHLGNNFTASWGSSFFSVESKVEFIGDLEGGFSYTTVQNKSRQQEFTLRTTESYSTSSDDQLIGKRSDLFVGGAMNLIWGTTEELEWDEISEDVIIDTSIMVTPNGFETIYVYTENQIRNTVIPNLVTIGDTTSASMWQGFLDENEANIDSAGVNINYPENLSFNAGASYSYTQTSNHDWNKSRTFETIIDGEAAATFGLVVNGHGVEAGYAFNTRISKSRTYNDGDGKGTKTSFTLADNDETSDLNFLADYFTVDVKQDTVYGTPVFDLLAGASSCPWEPNTLPREGVSFTSTPSSISGLQEGESAVFLLTLGNTSQTNEYRRYYLCVDQASNTGGAVIRVNGSVLGGTMTFDIPAGEVAEAVMTVSQGPIDYEYEDLRLEFYTSGDRGHEGPEGHNFYVFKEFDVSWEPPYSRITLDSPKENWIVNQANDDTLDILLKDYDLSKPDFKSLKLQYKHPADENWLPAFEIFRDSLETSHPLYIEVPWDISGLSDGLYEIRAATTDSVQTDYFTEPVAGVIDRISPEVLGIPQPADQILELGDEISLSFVEFIDPEDTGSTSVSLQIYGGDPIGIEYDIFENKVIIIPNIPNYWFENETLIAEVSGFKDLSGNIMSSPISWEFYVNSNPVNWNVTKLDVIKPMEESMTLTANLENSGGQYYSYVFTDYPDSLYHSGLQYHAPDWLTVTPSSGQLIPLDSQQVSFIISDQIGFGHYETTIYAHTSMGNEAIEIEVDVLSNPPNWSLTEFDNFQSSMSIIGELNIEGDLSVDINDIIGVFMENESGEWECRGVANIESVPYIPTHPYQVFLTIYSDGVDPVRAEDEIRFKVWDNSENKEYYQIDHSVFGGTLMYLANEVYGTPMNPTSLATVTDMVQDISLGSGWTWFSTNLDLVPNTINDVLGSLSPINDDFIKDQSQFAQYASNLWVGTLTTMDNSSMYKINVEDAQTLEIIGELRDPVTTTIFYDSGWNWISYIPHVSMGMNLALANRTNQTGDFIKNQAGYAFYVDADTGWIGSLRFMNPGDGFMLYAHASGDFEYPEYNIRFDDSQYPKLDTIVLRDAPDWSVNPQSYEYTASVTIELTNATNGNYMVGAFAGEECRGSVTPIELNGQWFYFLTVFSNTQNVEIDLKVYDGNADEIIDPNNSFTFFNDLILGSPSAPYELDITGALSAPQNVFLNVVNGEVQLSWDIVTGANSDKVFASDDPNGTFTDVSVTGTFTDNRWVATAPVENTFYKVVASSEASRESLDLKNSSSKKRD